MWRKPDNSMVIKRRSFIDQFQCIVSFNYEVKGCFRTCVETNTNHNWPLIIFKVWYWTYHMSWDEKEKNNHNNNKWVVKRYKKKLTQGEINEISSNNNTRGPPGTRAGTAWLLGVPKCLFSPLEEPPGYSNSIETHQNSRAYK